MVPSVSGTTTRSAGGARISFGDGVGRVLIAADDHRSYNRDGSAFDVGETFSGVDYETGLVAAGEFTDLVGGVEGLTRRRRPSPGSGSSPASRP